MAIRVDYMVRETASNLFRNFSITLASILTVFVSLALVGASLMAQQGVDRSTKRWQDGIEFIVYMNPEASSEQIDALQRELGTNTQLERIAFVNKEQALAEFRELFREQPEFLELVTADILPASFRVEPKDKSADAVTALSEAYRDRPGVRRVVSATETIRRFQRFSSFINLMIRSVALVLLFAAGLLILNTIRMAMFARRREIEVMKLVGATNWFVRVPFMAEGLIQGVCGAAMAVVGLAIFRPLYEGWLPSAEELSLFSAFVPASSDMLPIYLLLMLVGCLVGAVGAGIAVTRFLDV